MVYIYEAEALLFFAWDCERPPGRSLFSLMLLLLCLEMFVDVVGEVLLLFSVIFLRFFRRSEDTESVFIHLRTCDVFGEHLSASAVKNEASPGVPVCPARRL